MKLLFTGASGFLGRNIRPILEQSYDITTIGLDKTDTYQADLSKGIPELTGPSDVVLHVAGKAHVIPRTETEKKVFFAINYQGTVNLCQALEKCGIPKAFVFISTVAVYGCESGELINEDHPLNGNTPYALSKIQAENYLIDWCKKYGVVLGILRPSLLAGPNPPGNLGDMIRGIRSGKYLRIAGGKARKSILMAEDIGKLVPRVASQGGIYNVCDNGHPSFRELDELISVQLTKKSFPHNIPYWVAKSIALAGDCLGKRAPINSLKLSKITKTLTFDNTRARQELDWNPLNVLEHFNIE